MLLASWLAALVPIWATQTLPLIDWPNQLAQVAIVLRHNDPTWGLGAYHLHLSPVPYWGFFAPVWLLAHVFPVEIAGKLWLSGYALALPFGAARLARRLGRDPRLAVFVAPLVFSHDLDAGFVCFSGGLAALVWALAELEGFLQQPTRRRAAVLGGLVLAVYFLHPLPWLFFLVAGLALALLRPLVWRRVAIAAAVCVPSVLLALVIRAPGAGGFSGHYPPLIQRLSEGPSRVLVSWAGDGSFYVLLALAALWLGLVLTAEISDGDEAAQHGWRYRLEVVFFLAVLCAFVLPEDLHAPFEWLQIASRFVALACVFGALLPHGPVEGHRRLIVCGALALAIFVPIRLAIAWHGFDKRAASLRRIASEIPRGSSTLVLRAGNVPDPALDQRPERDPLREAHAWVQLWRGGFDRFAARAGFPTTADGLIAQPPTPQRALDTDNVDFILTRREIAPQQLGAGPFLIRTDGEWRLYRSRP
jgi:hypothetical protein